jgi:hypothetical protein
MLCLPLNILKLGANNERNIHKINNKSKNNNIKSFNNNSKTRSPHTKNKTHQRPLAPME